MADENAFLECARLLAAPRYAAGMARAMDLAATEAAGYFDEGLDACDKQKIAERILTELGKP